MKKVIMSIVAVAMVLSMAVAHAADPLTVIGAGLHCCDVKVFNLNKDTVTLVQEDAKTWKLDTVNGDAVSETKYSECPCCGCKTEWIAYSNNGGSLTAKNVQMVCRPVPVDVDLPLDWSGVWAARYDAMLLYYWYPEGVCSACFADYYYNVRTPFEELLWLLEWRPELVSPLTQADLDAYEQAFLDAIDAYYACDCDDHECDFSDYRSTATCWSGGWGMYFCECGENDGREYGWYGGLGHDPDYDNPAQNEDVNWMDVFCTRCGAVAASYYIGPPVE